MKPLRFIIITFLICPFFIVNGQQKTIQEKLGYSKDTRLLIIHADDLGVSHSENTASFEAMEKGSVTSGSILVPCPWFMEVADYSKKHPQADLGIHLALNSEWDFYKWGPVAPDNNVKGLINPEGFLYNNVADVVSHATIEEVEKELRAQIERAIQAGIDPTHFDTHMGALAATNEYMNIYIKLGREYKVPVLLTSGAAPLTNEHDVILDRVIIATPQDFSNGMKEFYINAIKSIQPGLTCLLLHAAYNDNEMKAVTINHPDYGAAWRQVDFNFFSSDECKKLLKQQNIKLITWREVRDKLTRK